MAVAADGRLRYHGIMTIVSKRRRSQTTGTGLMVRMETPFIARIDEWIFRHGELMTRAEAIRRLTARGLATPETSSLAAGRRD